jgi:hypothetical protein
MNQPVPEVTEKDVERIAIRDFGKERLALVMEILQEYGKQEWNSPGSPRVRLAILKLADGDLEKLKVHTKIAIQDFRDVLAMAEYPRFMTEIGFNEVDKKVENEVINDDWKQYREWFEKK